MGVKRHGNGGKFSVAFLVEAIAEFDLSLTLQSSGMSCCYYGRVEYCYMCVYHFEGKLFGQNNYECNKFRWFGFPGRVSQEV